jgi:hypothetical protein
MDQATLVSPDIEIGEEALRALDEAGIKQIVAVLAVLPEYGDWRLILSSPSLDQVHLLKAHEQIAEILRGHFVYRLPIIMVLPTRDPFIKELRRLFGQTKNVMGMRLGGQMIGNRFIDNAYVYRIQ